MVGFADCTIKDVHVRFADRLARMRCAIRYERANEHTAQKRRKEDDRERGNCTCTHTALGLSVLRPHLVLARILPRGDERRLIAGESTRPIAGVHVHAVHSLLEHGCEEEGEMGDDKEKGSGAEKSVRTAGCERLVHGKR